ncbi:hypothetical protein [Streptomyces hirsutus]|uniref:hypothetical protein n=1 Tax=Streptomyces hirsutus TaxID=35620 RepID=UPI003665AA9A
MADAPPAIIRRVSVFTERHWFVDCFTVDPEGSVLLKDAYATYLDFCREEKFPQYEVMSRLEFKRGLLRRGATQKRTNSGVALVGVKLR